MMRSIQLIISIFFILMIVLIITKKKVFKINKYRNTKLNIKDNSNKENEINETDNPYYYDELAKFLLRYNNKNDDISIDKYNIQEISKAIKALSKSQSALKSMDGMTHQVKNVFKESSSLQSRYEKFLKSKRKKLKEAAKVYEYTRIVERSLQSTEILQCITIEDQEIRTKYLLEAGLSEIKRFMISVNKITCVVSVLSPLDLIPNDSNITTSSTIFNYHNNNSNSNSNHTNKLGTSIKLGGKAIRLEERKLRSKPLKYLPGELIIAIAEDNRKDNINIAQLLHLISSEQLGYVDSSNNHSSSSSNENKTLHNTASTSASKTTVTNPISPSSHLHNKQLMIQPTYFTLACNLLYEIRDLLYMQETIENITSAVNNHSCHNSNSSSKKNFILPSNRDNTRSIVLDKKKGLTNKKNIILKNKSDSISSGSTSININDIKKHITTNKNTKTKAIDTINIDKKESNLMKNIHINQKMDSIYINNNKMNNNNNNTNEDKVSRKKIASSIVKRKRNLDSNNDYLYKFTRDKLYNNNNYTNSNNNTSNTISTISSSIKVIDSSKASINSHFTKSTITTTATIPNNSNNIIINSSSLRLPVTRIRLIGHSAGGAVAALAAMVLDGAVNSINISSIAIIEETNTSVGDNLIKNKQKYNIKNKIKSKKSSKKNLPKNNHNNILNKNIILHNNLTQSYNISRLIGSYSNHVQCISLGSPPCISRNIIPRYISSIICGDDMIPRAQIDSIREFSYRVDKALKSGAGRNSMSYMLGIGFLSDLSTVAGKSLGRYKDNKPIREDTKLLNVPGRVFFMKPRKLNDGATIQRVLRGNWQEDMLWQLHDVLISKRMIEHHFLEAYIRTLNRC